MMKKQPARGYDARSKTKFTSGRDTKMSSGVGPRRNRFASIYTGTPLRQDLNAMRSETTWALMIMDEVEITKALRAAVKDADVQHVRSLIGGSKERLRQMTPFGTWLHIAAKRGSLELVQCLISMGADVNVRGGTFGGTPINLAAGYGQLHIVRTLLAEGAELDVSEPERNPLFSAVQGGHLEIVKLLVERGIDYHVRYTGESMKDIDALAFARERGQAEIAEYLAGLKH